MDEHVLDGTLTSWFGDHGIITLEESKSQSRYILAHIDDRHLWNDGFHPFPLDTRNRIMNMPTRVKFASPRQTTEFGLRTDAWACLYDTITSASPELVPA